MRQAIESDKVATPVGPFSIAIRKHDTLYLSGQVGQDPATGKLVSGGIAAEAAQIFRNVSAILGAAGKSLDDVIKVTVYLTDMQQFRVLNEIYAEQFTRPYPARTTIGVAALPLGASVEIEVIAA